MKKLLSDLYYDELKVELNNLGLPNYKAGQIFKWLMKGASFEEMSDIDKKTRAILSENYIDIPAKIIQSLVAADGTEKYLFELSDGNIVEGVFMSYKYGNTVCISTQVGCRMGCSFCASTIGGFVRNLSAGEIVGQVIAVNKLKDKGEGRAVTNIVLMGSGEPLDNYNNVIKFVRLINDEKGINVSCRNISLSTCGLVNEMRKLANEDLQINLTISLHSPFDVERDELMPINRKYQIKEVIGAAKYYFEKTGRRINFEYVLIAGKNDSIKHVEALATLVRGFSVHVNLIRLNPVKERQYKSANNECADKFLNYLQKLGVSATLRRQMGVEINGACGQLRNKYVGVNDTQNKSS